MGFRRAAKVDDNQRELVAALRKCGYSVLITSQLKNCFDILVGAQGKNFAFEIKDPNKPPSARKLTEGEKDFMGKWKGQYAVVETLDDCLMVIKGRA